MESRCLFYIVFTENKIVSISNFNFVNYTTLAGFAVTLSGTQNEEFYYSNWYHYNIKAQHGFISAIGFNIIHINNAYFEKTYDLEFPPLKFDDSNEVILNNITFLNVNNTPGVKNMFVNFANFEWTITKASSMNITNCYLNSGMIIQSDLLLNQLTLTNGYFRDIYVEEDTYMIYVNNLKSINFQNLTIANIFSEDSNDSGSKFIFINDLTLEGDLNSTIQNIMFSTSDVSFMEVDSIEVYSTFSYSFDMINLTLTDLSYSTPKDVIKFNDFSYDTNFIATFKNWTFSNIHFDYYGKLFLVQQRLLTPVLVLNSIFTNLTSATIKISPFGDYDEGIASMLNFEDCTFNNINSGFSSFITGYDSAHINIDRWIFTNMHSYESGAVFSGKFDKVHGDIKNSIFKNNTALRGSIFIFEEFADVTITNCTFENNFALQSGVGDVRSSSVLEFINCTISNNYAIAYPISAIYEGYSSLTLNNWSISNNLAITKDQVLNELNNQWSKLCFVPNLFKDFVNSNMDALSFSFSEVALNPVYSNLNIVNGTIIQNQHTLISSIISEIIIEDSYISNITIIDEAGISLISSSLKISNVEITSLNSTEEFDFIQSIEDWIIDVTNLTFEVSNSNFINTISTAVSIENTSFRSIKSSRPIISIYSSSNNLLNEITIEDCNTLSNYIISITNWDSTEISKLNVSDIVNDTILHIKNSKITEIEDLSFINWYQAFLFENSVVSKFKESLITGNGGSNSLHGGAIRSINSNLTISNWTFISNTAQSGGAISFEWNSLLNWNLSLRKVIFDSNIALSQGGAIFYNYKRPQFNQTTFTNNQAIYGKDIASYAVKIRFNDSDSDQMKITDIASGIKYTTNITFKLLDYDNQTMILNNINQVELSSSNNS